MTIAPPLPNHVTSGARGPEQERGATITATLDDGPLQGHPHRGPRSSRAARRAPSMSPTSRTGSARPPVRRRVRDARTRLQAGLEPRPSRARGGVLVEGPPARPDRGLLAAHQGAPRPLDPDRRLRPRTRVPVLVPAHPRRGLRLRAAVAAQEADAPFRTAGRRPAPAGRSSSPVAPVRDVPHGGTS